jgi:hypothetical protein
VRITTKVKAAIFNEPGLKVSEIKVQTFKGVVSVSGVKSVANDAVIDALAGPLMRARGRAAKGGGHSRPDRLCSERRLVSKSLIFGLRCRFAAGYVRYSAKEGTVALYS